MDAIRLYCNNSIAESVMVSGTVMMGIDKIIIGSNKRIIAIIMIIHNIMVMIINNLILIIICNLILTMMIRIL